MRSMLMRRAVTLAAALVLAAVPMLPASPAWADDDEEIEIKDVGKIKRGEKDVKLRADVDKSDLVCYWRIKYADGNTDTVGEDESDKDGICEVEFEVPDRKSVVGDATIKLRVETKKGADRGKASRNFFVRDRRGG